MLMPTDELCQQKHFRGEFTMSPDWELNQKSRVYVGKTMKHSDLPSGELT